MKKMIQFFKNYYPDIFVQLGVFLLLVEKFRKCAGNPFSLSLCYDKVIDFRLVIPIMFITLGLNFFVRNKK